MSDEPTEKPGGMWGDAPTPEEQFANGTAPPARSSRYNVVLTDANKETPMACMKGVRDIMRALSGAQIDAFTADAMWQRFVKGERPLVIGWATTPEGAKEAAEAGVKASSDNIVVGYCLTSEQIVRIRAEHAANAEEPQQPAKPASTAASDEPEEDGMIRPLIGNTLVLSPSDFQFKAFDPSGPATKTALVLMRMCDGDPSKSIVWARTLRHSTEDKLFDEVVAILLGSLPVVWKADE